MPFDFPMFLLELLRTLDLMVCEIGENGILDVPGQFYSDSCDCHTRQAALQISQY